MLAESRIGGARALLSSPCEGEEEVYHAGGNSWYIDAWNLWDCIDEERDGSWPMGTEVNWSWALLDEEETILATCGGWEAECAMESGYHNVPDYECTGDESFLMGAWAYHWQHWPNGTLMFWYESFEDIPLGGCSSFLVPEPIINSD